MAALVVSLMEGSPAGLPGVALGSEVLLHVERAAALFAIVVASVSVLAQGARGRLPTHLSTAGLAYEPEPVEHAAGELQIQIDDLRADVDRLANLALDDRMHGE